MTQLIHGHNATYLSPILFDFGEQSTKQIKLQEYDIYIGLYRTFGTVKLIYHD